MQINEFTEAKGKEINNQKNWSINQSSTNKGINKYIYIYTYIYVCMCIGVYYIQQRSVTKPECSM